MKQSGIILEAANRVALNILTNQSGVEALRHIVEAARELVQCQYAAIGVTTGRGCGLSEFVAVGLRPEEELKIGDLPAGKGILGLLLERQAPLRISTLSDHPASVGFPAGHPAMSSFLGVPIMRGNEAIGSLYLTNKLHADAFTEEDELAVLALSSHAAVAIYNMQMLLRQRHLVKELMAAQEEERRAIAYDLHDGLTQFVMAAQAHLESFKRATANQNAERASRELDQGLRYLKEAVLESRRLVNGLRSLALDELGLSGAVEQLINEEKERAGWTEANLIHNIANQRFEQGQETAAYRVVQEALTNVRKHAGARRVQVLLLLSGGPENPELTLEVRDWGCGFVHEARAGDTAHFGLHGMAERVQLMGGLHTIETAPGAGATIRAVLPALLANESGDANS